MRVLVDTPVWSLAFRRKPSRSASEQRLVAELTELIGEARAAIIGPIRQEVLSGITGEEQFRTLRERLEAFEDEPIGRADYERAADFLNQCRRAGIQGSHVDFLICAVAAGHALPVFTTDQDFPRYARRLDVPLYVPRTTS